jgi:carbamoyl-phosphate synthase large subunit
VNDRHKADAVEVARKLHELGFQLVATRGTCAAIRQTNVPCKTVFKVNEGRPNAADLLKAGAVQLVIYTAAGALSFSDERAIRRGAVQYRVPCITTLSGARAAAEAIASRRRDPIRVWNLQEIHSS